MQSEGADRGVLWEQLRALGPQRGEGCVPGRGGREGRALAPDSRAVGGRWLRPSSRFPLAVHREPGPPWRMGRFLSWGPRTSLGESVNTHKYPQNVSRVQEPAYSWERTRGSPTLSEEPGRNHEFTHCHGKPGFGRPGPLPCLSVTTRPGHLPGPLLPQLYSKGVAKTSVHRGAPAPPGAADGARPAPQPSSPMASPSRPRL